MSCPAAAPTAKCAILVSSVSPDRADTTHRVHLDQHRVGRPLLHSPADSLHPRGKKVVTQDLDPAPRAASDFRPCLPVLLCEAIFQTHHEVTRKEWLKVLHHLLPRQSSPRRGEMVEAVPVEMACCRIEAEGYLLASVVTGP